MLGIVTLSLLYTVTIFAGYRHYGSPDNHWGYA